MMDYYPGSLQQYPRQDRYQGRRYGQPSQYGQNGQYGQPPRPLSQDITLQSASFQDGPKTFKLLLKENFRGRFLRIVETNGNRFSSIVVPANGLGDFQQMLDNMAAAKDMEINDSRPA